MRCVLAGGDRIPLLVSPFLSILSFFLFLTVIENYSEKDIAEGYKIIEKIAQIVDEKKADKRELLLLTYKYLFFP